MGRPVVVGRLLVKDQAPSEKPEPGEIILKAGDVWLGTEGGYVRLGELAKRVEELAVLLEDTALQEMIEGYRQARDLVANFVPIPQPIKRARGDVKRNEFPVPDFLS